MRTMFAGSVPMAVPHTRPIAITHHANRPELLTGESPWRGELRIPSSAQALLEVRLGEAGHDAMGFVAHVPHYLAQMDYPRAAAALLEQVELAGRLTVDLSGLPEGVATGGSVGMSLYPDDGESADDLIKHGDRDMYERKRVLNNPQPS